MKKRGQVYLIAALVIIGVIISFATIYNSADKTAEDTSIYDLSDEIDFEANKVLEHGTFNSLSKEDIEKNLETITDFYSKTNNDKDLLVVYGDEQSVKVILYDSSKTGSAGIDFDGQPVNFDTPEIFKFERNQAVKGGSVRVKLGRDKYFDFQLKRGQNFFVVLEREINNETLVAISKSPKEK